MRSRRSRTAWRDRCTGHFDLLVESRLNIIAEVIIPIAHNLIGLPGVSFEEIAVVESHPWRWRNASSFS